MSIEREAGPGKIAETILSKRNILNMARGLMV
jgi:hypothetical protein